jgi:hypothetical protein
MKLTLGILVLALACATLFGRTARTYLCRFTLAFGLLLSFVIPAHIHAQQYMKGVNATDAQFDAWVKDKKLVKCRAMAQAAYPDGPPEIMTLGTRPSGVCYWNIDRAAELAPPALVVHAGTRIFVRIRHPRQNEILQPAVVFAKIVPPSPGNDILKNAVNPLQAITLSPGVHPAATPQTINPSVCDTTASVFNADACQVLLVNQINSIQASVNHANAALACLESYQIATPSEPPELIDPKPTIQAYACSPVRPINPDESDPSQPDGFVYQKNLVVTAIKNALALTPPLAVFNQFDKVITNNLTTYSAEISSDGEIKNAIGNIQSAQATLQQSYVLLLSIPSDSLKSQFYYFDVPHLTTATVTITGIEIVSKTSNTIATWTASSTSYNIVLSAGLGFSNLVYRTYASTPQVVNGVPVLNSSGNALSVVTETDTHLSVMAPEILGSYVIPGLRKLDSACSFGCSLLLTGGVGANLTTKSADFDLGASLRLMDFLVTPAVHFGRESRLIDGITVGSQLGANAPSTLPTQTKWVRKFGIVFTYVIPLS